MILQGVIRMRRIVRVADLLEPIDRLAVERFLDGDMGHGCLGTGAVPVLFPGPEAHHITGQHSFERAVLFFAPGRGLP